MRLITKILSIFGIILCITVTSYAQKHWVGNYFFDEDGGKTVGGSKIYIIHTIEITETSGKLDAYIYSQGFQTSREIFADVKVSKNKLEFYFREKGINQKNAIYKKGDFLFLLRKKKENGRVKLLTSWKTYKPLLSKNKKSSRIYFKKIRESFKRNQSKLKWTRIKSPSNWTFAIPKNHQIRVKGNNYIVEYSSQELSIYVKLNKKYNAKKHFKERFSFLSQNKRKAFDFFEMGNFIGAQYKDESETSDSEQRLISFASDKWLNDISISTKNSNSPTFLDFLDSIKLNGKELFKTGESKITETETISLTSIRQNKKR